MKRGATEESLAEDRPEKRPAAAVDSAQSSFHGHGLQNSGRGNITVGRDLTIGSWSDNRFDCQRDLFVTNPAEDRKALKRKKGGHAPGTCGWILHTTELTAWLGSGPTGTIGPEKQAAQVLWLHGNPGTGKSTMTIYLTEELPKAYLNTNGEMLAYFFCDSGFDKQKTATSILRGLIHQLVGQHEQLLDYLLPIYHKRGAETFKSFDALWEIFTAMAADQNTGRKYCIIDALDECDRESQNTLLAQLEETFLSQGISPNIRILITTCQLYQEEEDVETRLQFTREYIESCRLMIIIQDENVLLLHKSVKDYLFRARFIQELEAHAQLAYRCVDLLIAQFRNANQLHSSLLDYAILEWADHARMACSDFKVQCPQAEFFQIDSPCREQWLQQFRSKTSLCLVPKRFSIFHVAAKWGISALVDYASDLGVRDSTCAVHINCRDDSGQMPLEHAAGSRYPNAVTAFLSHGGEVTTRVVQAAAGNLKNGREVIALLLDRCGNQMTLTKAVAKAAAGNMGNGKEVISLLLDRYNCPTSINNGVVSTIAGGFDDKVMALLLNRYGDQITITNEVVKAAVGNKWNSKEVIKLLLSRYKDQITITDEIVAAMAENRQGGKEVMVLFLNGYSDLIRITDEVVSTIAGGFDNKVMALLLDRYGDQITFTNKLVRAAAGNRENGKEVIKLLLGRYKNQITITNELLSTIAKSFDGEVMALLLARYEDRIPITDHVLKTVARSWHGKEVMELLFDRCEGQITITEEVVKAAAQSQQGKEVIGLLLDRCEDQIPVTNDMLKTVARRWHGKGVMKLLLDRCGDRITITSEVVKAVAGNNNGKEVMGLLLDRYGDWITITDDVAKAAAKNWRGKEVSELLLDRHEGQMSIIDEVVKAMARNMRNGKEALALFHARYRDHTIMTSW
ncbi:uncharacterized protein N7484_000978 [Penicillium longicatenatum]|uniref:uncharacterized protein n=1 Tax=Penicillium longicatenatum TaxID=1561947 RepID=UPI002548C14A|nr:uncharacterized protein N7484_000978 [Penicillium longicatenatum]KAJ5657329.1 hypothetical protein N7484_000978 [Penicillium longicatenatum]